jgi:glycine cleavage system T protein (aminomethyltransferase)
MDGLKRTPLYGLHLDLGAKMVPFAGWEMPVQYPMGVLKEHLHTRAAAGLFDVSHMGQVQVTGAGADAALETLVPADLVGLAAGRQRYGLFTDAGGGILDDLMAARPPDDRGGFYLVVNAGRRDEDLAHLRQGLPGREVREMADRALLALQGPAAEAALEALVPGVAAMRFMDHAAFGALWISRSGYTGEDGYEISVPAAEADALARRLLAMSGVMPIGLGARDSLRLEAGLCLYGSDIDTATTPAEAALGWAIPKARRQGPRAGGFPGAERILAELAAGPARLRTGLLPEGRAPMRHGTLLFAAEADGDPLGEVTSGGFGPSIERPLAMAYLPAALAAPGTRIWGEVRGKRLPALTAAMPFRPSTYKR